MHARHSLTAFVLVVHVACAPAAPRPVPPIVAPIARNKPEVKEKTPEHPARWLLEPDDHWLSRAHLELGDKKGTLYVGAAGERWLQASGRPAVSASQLLPEELTGVLRLPDGKTGFLGESGTMYLTLDPLGAPTLVRPPPHPVRAATAGKSAALLLTAKNELLRSIDGGATWDRVVLPKSDSVLFDVAMSGSRGLLLGMPQRVFYTVDDGASFVAIGTLSLGARYPYVGVGGELVLAGEGEGARFRESPPSLERSLGASMNPKLERASTRGVKRSVLAGSRLFEIADNPSYQHDKASADGEARYTFAVAELGAPPVGRKLHLFDACKSVELGALGEVVEISCLTELHDEAVDNAGSAVTRPATRFYRSIDAGENFAEDGLTTETLGDARPFVGPEGFLLFRNERCGKGGYSKGKGFVVPKGCPPAYVRPAGGAKLVAVPEGATVHHAWLAADLKRKEMLSLGEAIDAHSVALYRFKLDGSAPEKVSVVDAEADAWSASSGAITVDDAGAIVIALKGGAPRSWKLHRSFDEGATFQTTALGSGIDSIALAGTRALSTEHGGALESGDSGVTWSRVQNPAKTTLIECSAYGCLTNRGLRVGWDLPLAQPLATERKRAPKWATPLRCTLKDGWVDAGRGDLPGASGLDPRPELRAVAPKRLEDEHVVVVVTDAAGKTKELPLLGPPTKGELARSQTTTYVQPGGVIAARYSYLRKKQPFGPLSAVDADLAWFSNATGKVHHASFKQLATWKVAHDPQAPGTLPHAYPYGPEILTIAPGGLWFASPAYDQKLLFVHDSGVIEKLAPPTDLMSYAEIAIAPVGKGFVLYEPSGRDGTTRSLWFDPTSKEWKSKLWTLWAAGGGRPAAVLEPTALPGPPGIHVTFRGSELFPATEFAVALEPSADPGPILPVVGQGALADPPASCETAALLGARTQSPGTLGARHPVVVEGEPTSIVLATDEAILKTTGAATCASVYLAPSPSSKRGDAVEHAAVIRPSALGSATLYRVDRSVWPAKLSTRAMSCTFTPGPLPKELDGEPGF